MSDQYWLRLRGKTTGPFTFERLRAMADRGQLNRFHRVSVDQQNWQPIEAVQGLSPEPAAPTNPAVIPGPLPTNAIQSLLPEPPPPPVPGAIVHPPPLAQPVTPPPPPLGVTLASSTTAGVETVLFGAPRPPKDVTNAVTIIHACTWGALMVVGNLMLIFWVAGTPASGFIAWFAAGIIIGAAAVVFGAALTGPGRGAAMLGGVLACLLTWVLMLLADADANVLLKVLAFVTGISEALIVLLMFLHSVAWIACGGGLLLARARPASSLGRTVTIAGAGVLLCFQILFVIQCFQSGDADTLGVLVMVLLLLAMIGFLTVAIVNAARLAGPEDLRRLALIGILAVAGATVAYAAIGTLVASEGNGAAGYVFVSMVTMFVAPVCLGATGFADLIAGINVCRPAAIVPVTPVDVSTPEAPLAPEPLWQ